MLSFFPLLDGKPRFWNTVERFGMEPEAYQEILHEKAAYYSKKYLSRAVARTQIEGDFILFRIVTDGI